MAEAQSNERFKVGDKVALSSAGAAYDLDWPDGEVVAHSVEDVPNEEERQWVTLGRPDGMEIGKNGLPWTYHSSWLVHPPE